MIRRSVRAAVNMHFFRDASLCYSEVPKNDSVCNSCLSFFLGESSKVLDNCFFVSQSFFFFFFKKAPHDEYVSRNQHILS